jgi:hypothetical protein
MPIVIVVNKTNTQQPLNSFLGILNGNGAKTTELTSSQLEQSRDMLVSLANAGAITWTVASNNSSGDDAAEFVTKAQVASLISSNVPALPVVWDTASTSVTDNIVAVFDTLTSININSESTGVVALGCQTSGLSTIDGSFSGILSGQNNRVWDDWCVIAGGQNNKIGETGASNFSVVTGGRNNLLESGDCFIGGGSGNQCHSSWSTVVGGRDNYVGGSASYSAITGGFGNRCEGAGSSASGIQAYAKNPGVKAFASGQYSEIVPAADYGNQQVTEVVLRGETPGTATNETTHLKSGGFFDVPTGTLQPQDNKTYYIETKLVARKQNGTSKVFFNRTLASYAGATPTYVGANDTTQAISIGSPNALWNVVVSHNEGIDVAFNTGAGVTDKVRVVAYVKMVEVFSA